MIKMSAVLPLLSIALMLLSVPSESLKCYQCMDEASCAYGQANSAIDCSGQCVTYRKTNEDSKEHLWIEPKSLNPSSIQSGIVIRRCCSTACEMKEEVREHISMDSCSEDRCNGIQSDGTLVASVRRQARKSSNKSDSKEDSGASLSCYDCSGHNPNCGVSKSTLEGGCKACMVYLNVNDGNNVIRRCCKSNCGEPGTIAPFEGRQAYFCSSSECNGLGAETKLPGANTSTTTTSTSTTTVTTTTAIRTTTAVTTTTTVQTSFSCYDCSDPGQQICTAKTSNCPMCMVYRNDQDPTKFDRRCCWWACGAPNQISNHGGRPTYFCNADNCNAPGSEYALGYITTTSTAAVTTTTTTARQTSFQCYDCSGPDCGKDGSALSTNCPTCMVYRNPEDQTKVERRCCWWGCGTPNSVSNHNGRETYFCASDKCNGIGAESMLTRPVTTTTTTAMTTRTTTAVTTPKTTTSRTTTSSVSSCTLNCQNGGTLETAEGCFCYCSEYTSGRECEDIDCTQEDVDPDVCSLENQVLCEESESFAFECRHLCGKC